MGPEISFLCNFFRHLPSFLPSDTLCLTLNAALDLTAVPVAVSSFLDLGVPASDYLSFLTRRFFLFNLDFDGSFHHERQRFSPPLLFFFFPRRHNGSS